MTMTGVPIDPLLQRRRARRALKRRLYKEWKIYGMIGLVMVITGSSVPYNGKGDRFEFQVKFDSGQIGNYEVTVYGEGRSYRIWEI